MRLLAVVLCTLLISNSSALAQENTEKKADPGREHKSRGDSAQESNKQSPGAETEKETAKSDDKKLPGSKEFAEGWRLQQAGQLESAIRSYDRVWEIHQMSGSCLFNAGLCAWGLKQYKRAEKYWLRYQSHFPQKWDAHSWLIRLYNKTNQSKKRDAERKKLKSKWQSKTDKKLSKKSFYVFDEFKVSDGFSLIVYEHFELQGRFAKRYQFQFWYNDSTIAYSMSMGSYPGTNAVLREQGKLKKDQRVFHLDAYANGGHETWGMWIGEPDYDTIKQLVIDATKSEEGTFFASLKKEILSEAKPNSNKPESKKESENENEDAKKEAPLNED